ncbi:hypothetical protein AJ88_42900 [Mesorhizobium amorphae CCBAU 01583]|nr:hypothetical protein AJ88_42900 [Mesorhizobium amorphae CCBAU 01583]
MRATSGDFKRSLILAKLSKDVSSRKRNSGMYFICRSAPETRPRTNFACLLSASTTASVSLTPSGETKAVAIFRSGDMRTSDTETTAFSISGSMISPRCRVSDKAWRTCSPTRSMRWDGPDVVERGIFLNPEIVKRGMGPHRMSQ